MKKFLLSMVGLVMAACSSHPTMPETAANPPAEPNQAWRNPSMDTTPDYITEGGAAANLDNCGGHDGRARLIRSTISGKLYVDVTGMECGSWASSNNGYQIQKLQKNLDGERGSVIPVDENNPGWHELVVGSPKFLNAYKNHESTGNTKGDVVRFYVPARKVVLDLHWRQKTEPMPLRSCGGTVQAQINDNRTVSVVFRGLTRCEIADFMDANGAAVPYGPYSLQEQHDSLGGSYTIPAKVVDFGTNGVTMRVYRRGAGEDRIQIRFFGL